MNSYDERDLLEKRLKIAVEALGFIAANTLPDLWAVSNAYQPTEAENPGMILVRHASTALKAIDEAAIA